MFSNYPFAAGSKNIFYIKRFFTGDNIFKKKFSKNNKKLSELAASLFF